MSDELKERVLSIAKKREEFITDVDGFLYWWPNGSKHGHLSSDHLRILADELDKKNAPWVKQIDDYFKGKEKS